MTEEEQIQELMTQKTAQWMAEGKKVFTWYKDGKRIAVAPLEELPEGYNEETAPTWEKGVEVDIRSVFAPIVVEGIKSYKFSPHYVGVK